jgi:hypothetical protein
MEPRGNGEVSRSSDGNLGFRQSATAISSLNEAWFHTLDEYVIDTPLNEVLLPLLRNCFFGGAVFALLLLQKGHGDQVACDIAGFITKSRSRDLPGLQIRH